MNKTESIYVINDIIQEWERLKLETSQAISELAMELEVKVNRKSNDKTILLDARDILDEHFRNKLTEEEVFEELKSVFK